ncbi:MAG: redoxin domain-containing protein [Pirellulales bacterium]|nr:redoxin domain-containing protein [Pirellulales bacterium]
MRYIVLLLLVLILTPVLEAAPIEIPRSRSERPKLKSIYGVTHQMQELVAQGKSGVVFIFTDVDCPVAQLYLPRLKALYEEYGPQGIAFYAIYPNNRIDILEMAEHAHDTDLPYPAMVDIEQRLADLLDAEKTPEVVLLDGDWEKQYQGAIDDQFKRQGRKPGASVHYLRDAIEQVLAGKTPKIQFTTASGCPIERMKPPAARTGITYHRDIAPIMQKHCQGCHRSGGAAPFELITYEDAYYSAQRIQENVVERRMPPWHGFLNPEYGKLSHNAQLSEREVRLIDDWVRSGAAEGNITEAPPEKVWPDEKTWTIGKPDYIYETDGFLVPKTGILDYQFFRVKLGFDEDRWFRAVEVKPGSTEVVHHVGLHVVPSSDKAFTGFSGMAELYGLGAEGAILINDYVPGDIYNAKHYPPEQAVRIPKNSDLIFEIHYTPNHREEVFDQSRVGFIWAEKPPREEVFTKVFRKPIGRFRIPSHTSHHTMQDSCYFEHDVLIDAIRPHFHYRGKSFRLERVNRDPETDEIAQRETILSVPVWDPDWQRTYELETPIWLPAGSELLATGNFDNSYLNPNNPDPSVSVEYGQQSSDEMFSVRYKYRIAPSETQKAPNE